MALRPPRAGRGWWRYSRLIGWQLAVLAVAAGSSVLRAAGVADHFGQEWGRTSKPPRSSCPTPSTARSWRRPGRLDYLITRDTAVTWTRVIW